jgi:hypothetical protein
MCLSPIQGGLITVTKIETSSPLTKLQEKDWQRNKGKCMELLSVNGYKCFVFMHSNMMKIYHGDQNWMLHRSIGNKKVSDNWNS